MAGRARPRRDAVLHARAVLPRRARPVPASTASSTPGIARVVAAVEDPNPAGAAAAGSRICGRTASSVEVGLGAARGRAAQSAVLHADARGTAVRHPQGGDQPRRLHRRGAGRSARTSTSAAGQPARARVRAEVDAIGVGVGTILADDPLLTARGVLSRAAADAGGLRSPAAHAADARVLSTRDAGPVIIVTTAAGAARARRPAPARGAGRARSRSPRDGTFRAALERLAEREIGSLLLEGGAALHEAAWDEGLVDFVRLYVTPHVARAGRRRRFSSGRGFATADLVERRVEPLGPDVLIEGYVHRPH